MTLEYFRGFALIADRFTLNATVDEDYEPSGISELDERTREEYLFEKGFDGCEECWIDGYGLLGTIDEDEYSVVYTNGHLRLCPSPDCYDDPEDFDPDTFEEDPVLYDLIVGDVPDDFLTRPELP